ncbi:MFS transporter [Candidatus Levyibacteriota bacterium]|nr:MFS transporter [Candidatus Levybacteria bacterium]
MQTFNNYFKKNQIYQVLCIKPFLFLMISEFFSQLAFNLQHFVFIFLIYKVTNSNTAVSALIISFTIPSIIFSILAGVLVDRWNKKAVLFNTNIIRGLLLIPFLIPNLHFIFILINTFLIAVVTQFFLPAESAIIPLLVPRRLITPANAIFSIGIYSTIFLGYILSGPALLILGDQKTILLLASLFFVSAIAIFFVNFTQKKKKILKESFIFGKLSKSFFSEVNEVINFIKKGKKLTKALIVITVAQSIVFTFAALGPGYVATILNVEIENLSWIILGPAAIGMIFGAIYIGSINKKYRNEIFISMGIVISGIVFIFLPLGSKLASKGFVHILNRFIPGGFLDLTILHIIVLLSFISGIANSMVFVPSNIIIQSQTTDEMRGRVFGFLNSMVASFSILPVIIAGGLADVFGISKVITAMGIILFFGGTAMLVKNK